MAKKWYEKGPVGVIYKAGKDTGREIMRPSTKTAAAKKSIENRDKAQETRNIAIETSTAGTGQPGGQPGGQNRLGLSPIGGGDIDRNFGSLISADDISKDYESKIGANEDPNAAGAGVRGQFAALGSLAKMREGAQARTEQSAIQRRLAASGMSGSGAGMRMAQQAQGDSARRSAETGLGLAAQQFGAEQGAMEAATGRNMQREQMRLGAAEATAGRNMQREQMRVGTAESAAGRTYATQLEQRRGEQADAQMELDKNITAMNQATARKIERYNDSGFLSQIFGDIFGRR